MRGTIGVGAAFQRARTRRGITLEDAARDTRMRIEMLRALEDERFDALPGQVYVRGALRSYAGYLGLPAAEVVAWYRRHVDPMEEESLTVRQAVDGVPRRRDDHRLAASIAVGVFALAAMAGIVRTVGADQGRLPLPRLGGGGSAFTEPVTLALTTARAVTVTVRLDGGVVRTYDLRAGEGRSFRATTELQIEVADPSAVSVLTVNSLPVTLPATRGQPWTQVYRAGAVAVATAPEPEASASVSVAGP